jgi:DNA-binding XRE family transcriptional regulator
MASPLPVVADRAAAAIAGMASLESCTSTVRKRSSLVTMMRIVGVEVCTSAFVTGSETRSSAISELRHYRKGSGLTQGQLSERIHFSEGLISGIETGQLPASPEFARS